jgi:sigma-B regulation protein RsbU (phosphoserine phosphatase)
MMEALDSLRRGEKLEAHISTMYRVAALTSATLSPSALREKLFDALMETLNPDRVFLVIHGDGSREPVQAHRFRPEIQARGLVTISQSVVQHVTRSREAVLVESSEADERFSHRLSIVRQSVGSCVCAPLIRHERVVGVLYADRIALGGPFEPFGDEDVKLLSAIAAQFSVAYENAVMYEQSVEFGKRLSALNEAARHVSGSLDLDRIAGAAGECAARILDGDRCAVLLWDEGSAAMRLAYANWIPKAEWAAVQVRQGEGVAGRALESSSAQTGPDPLMGPASLAVPIPAGEHADRSARPAGVVAVAGRAFDESDQKLLGILSAQAGTSIRNASLELGRKLHDHELSIAARIQSRLLPKRLPELAGFDLFAYYQPKEAVGGDYYDFIPIDADRLGLVVADVSGKGVPASLVMAEFRTFLHVLAPSMPNPVELMSRVNRKLHEDLPRNMFVTAVYGIVDRRDGSLTFVCCGHNPLVLWRQGEGRLLVSKSSGTALGPVASESFDGQLQQFRATLSSGDRLVLYSDGLVETMNPQDRMYESRLHDLVRNTAGLSSSEFTSALVKDLDEFRAGRDLPDDLTIVTARRV